MPDCHPPRSGLPETTVCSPTGSDAVRAPPSYVDQILSGENPGDLPVLPISTAYDLAADPLVQPLWPPAHVRYAFLATEFCALRAKISVCHKPTSMAWASDRPPCRLAPH